MLENFGVLVVQIPSDVPSASNAEVARYLTDQLNAAMEATAERMAALGIIEKMPGATGQGNTVFSREEEEEFLEFLNDPASQLEAP